MESRREVHHRGVVKVESKGDNGNPLSISIMHPIHEK